MNRDNRFWTLVAVLSIYAGSNTYVSITAVKQNQERITFLEQDKWLALAKIEQSSRETSEKVVEALNGLTTVFAQRSANEERMLWLLEAIHELLNKGEKHGQ